MNVLVCLFFSVSYQSFARERQTVCRTPSNWNGGTLITYHGDGNEYLRKYLELYFDAPLLIRSFYHNCSSNRFLFTHQESCKFSGDTIFGSADVLRVVSENCRSSGTLASSQQKCACVKASEYTSFVVTMLWVTESATVEPLQQKPLFLPIDALADYETASTIVPKFEKIFLRFGFNPQTPLTESLHKNLITHIGWKNRMMSSDDEAFAIANEDEIRRCVIADCRQFGCENLRRVFPSVNSWFSRGLMQIENREPSVKSSLFPNVNVLIPTKTPENIGRCIESLLHRADLSFGAVRFHFGIDWGDNLTQKTVQDECKILDAQCEFHEVFQRGGDVSGIVNHMFMNIDERAYFFRFNDDTEMLTDGWNRKAISSLRQHPVDIGLAFIMDTGNPTLQTHSFVSHQHKLIFGYYFPLHFKNIYEDDWITGVYRGPLSKKSFVALKHHAKSVRYQALHIPPDVLSFSVRRARTKISKFIKELEND